ncbi:MULTISPECIES: serine/threonine-protein kinase [Glycomyces]|uniref:non-specific serine/threonine protein kinase n=2 Tax=Glycomyces TaxID=58113 RepID=A0A9X3PI12_9ACTN|nr:serine/threonine-protein kinase [Glycomyces lechevalierae]MDA1385866.1 serine/threonine-protein kinase [Glycomyces lechevalierae]MDR7339987.1 serine/threonine-protein kinase [Glycomyces lechevalierae]
MDDTASPFPSHEKLARLLPGYAFDPEPLNTSNMSQVHLATDTRLHHRKVAVKIIADYLAAHPVYRKRFLREIQLMASLEHPNIMYVITAAAEDGELLYFVMPRAERDLKTLLAAGRLDLAKTADVIAQAARALDHAHDRGVVHRDVKPGNLLFGPDGHVYLTDFGVAKEHFGEDLTTLGESIGTRGYTAPEVFAAGAAEAATADPPAVARMLPCTPRERAGDVYSLGAVIYHCLTGRRPFDQPDENAALEAQRRGDLALVSARRHGLPAGLDAVVAKAMHLDPDQRYDTCGELAAALTQALGLAKDGMALPILRDIQDRLRTDAAQRDDATAYAGAMPAPDTGPRRDQTRNMLLSLVVAVLAVALAGGLLLYQLFQPEDAEAGSAGEGASTASPSATASPTANLDPPSPTVEPVAGDEQVTRYPTEGECLSDDPDYYVVVACDSPAATEVVYRIVYSPEDPNPSQPEHEDAAWIACGGGDIDFEYRWRDSDSDADEGEEAVWDPATDRIYWIMCYRYL